MNFPAVLHTLLAALGAAGALAIVWRAVRSGLLAGWVSVEATALRRLAEVSARNGDLTLLAERAERAEALRARRRRAALAVTGWFLLLAMPLAAGAGVAVFAPAAALWLLRGPRRARATRGGNEPPPP